MKNKRPVLSGSQTEKAVNDSMEMERIQKTALSRKPEMAWAHRDEFYAEAILLHDINLTQDLLEEELYEAVDGNYVALLPLIGMQAPCSYSMFLTKWAEGHIAPEDRQSFLKNLNRERLLSRHEQKGERKIRFEYHSLAGSDDTRAVMCQTIVFIRNNAGDIIARCVTKDITEQRTNEIMLHQQLLEAVTANQRLQFEDELTGFPNKRGFIKQLRTVLSQTPDDGYALCYSDIQNLGYVNTTYGYETGDRLLRFFSQFFAGLLESVAVLGRVSGDFFAALVRLDVPEWRIRLEENCRTLQERMQEYCHTIDPHLTANVYIGVYLVLPEDIEKMDIDRMLDRASIAQETAKRTGSLRLTYYNDEQWKIRRRHISISHHLSSALANGEIEAWIQPQCNYEHDKISGAEVLCRWNSSFLGFISPGEFIPILEASGQIYELDRYIWEQACIFLRRRLDSGRDAVPLSVNISRLDIMNPALMPTLLGLLQKYQLSPDWLRLEITESAYMNEPEKLIGIAEDLRDAGFTIEMDDFGSGFSSLNMLKEVPVDVLKMDLRFLSHNGQSKKGGNIISSVIRMAQALNMDVIAEGVETVEQAEALRSMGCSIMQGFLFSRAVPVPEFEKMLDSMGMGISSDRTETDDLSYIYELMDTNTKSSYIFHHFSNSTAVLEYDGTHLEIMTVNDEYLRTIGDTTAATRREMQNALALVRPEDRPRLLAAVQLAIKTGRASCEVYYPSTGQWATITYRHVFTGQVADYLFSEVVNTSERHRLSEEIERISSELNDKIDMLPVGTFRYDADGEQEFDFISTETAILLNYPSVEALREKFHNKFPEMIYYEDRDRVLQEIDEQIAENGHKDYCEYRIETGDGKLKWVFDHGHLVTDADGNRWYYVAIADMDHIKKEREEQERLVRKYHAFLQVPGVHTFEYDISTNHMTVHIARAGKTIEDVSLPSFLAWAEENATAATVSAIRDMIARARTGPINGSILFEGRLIDDVIRRYHCCYASMDKDGRNQLVGVTSLLPGQ